ncbi:hypothetical protein SAMN05660826_00477 [Caldanaerovirga acetigignens]|uniref:Uncharacterized protein n=1 Tax=Caldanaerovirga acetigignens TaxID=447595 RepID=A0A1M7GVV5_9FIRM|nr:hypothetical protein SAMN05660826_00477 [Caldanaerovirga acetigignens]
MAFFSLAVVLGIFIVVIYLYYRENLISKDCGRKHSNDELQYPIPKFPQDEIIDLPKTPQRKGETKNDDIENLLQ